MINARPSRRFPSPWDEASDRVKGSLPLLEKSLSERDLLVIKMRYGITDSIYHTLEETGRMFGLTRERIRQIEARALEYIRLNEL